ncbi:unnamed protein product, partial [Didymodactylos carnosus]
QLPQFWSTIGTIASLLDITKRLSEYCVYGLAE